MASSASSLSGLVSPLLRAADDGATVCKGPVTRARQRRTLVIYLGLCLIGAVPLLLEAPAGWQAAGVGLWLPGGGFLATGGWAMLLFPLALALFVLALLAWFWAGMVVAPVGIWLGAAALAGALAGPSIWPAGPPLAAAATIGIALAFRRRTVRLRREGRAKAVVRRAFLPASLAEVEARVSVPAPEHRELTADDLTAVRYLLDRALQPVPEWGGFTMLDQYQPAALRYQINHLGMALAIVQGVYVPAFRGYMGLAQRNMIEKYLLRKVWDYWVHESCWGHLNFTDWDPAKRDNIMLTGWYGLHVGAYMLHSGDRRYLEPGSLTFRLNRRMAWAHSFSTLIDSVRWNYDREPFGHYPCEPNWIYPICNAYGMASLTIEDALCGSDKVRRYLPDWLAKLDSEFTDESGSIIGLRSQLTGLPVRFPISEGGYALMANIFAPDRARALWAVARREIAPAVQQDAQGRPRLMLPAGIDFGNYRRGNTGAYGGVLIGAREFGDDALAEAAQNALDAECGLSIEGGVRRYLSGSNRANIFAVMGKIVRTGDFGRTFSQGPAPEMLRGPVLEEASYPQVLVARAVSDGASLDLVLHPGAGDGLQAIGLAQLAPGRRYRVSGAAETEIVADAEGRAPLTVPLCGRTAIHVAPTA